MFDSEDISAVRPLVHAGVTTTVHERHDKCLSGVVCGTVREYPECGTLPKPIGTSQSESICKIGCRLLPLLYK